MRIRILLISVLAFCSTNQVVQAGMPTPTLDLTEPATMRFQSISFFLLVLLISAFVFKKLWNVLARDFPKMPVLSYKGALAGAVLWGLLFLFVLTMISGARELLTPGAWKKTGHTYELVDSDIEEPKPPASLLDERRAKMSDLRTALFMHVASHQGNLPEKQEAASFAEEFWLQPGSLNVKYGYVDGQKTSDPSKPLAFEQAVYEDGQQLVLFVDGSIKALPLDKAKELLGGK